MSKPILEGRVYKHFKRDMCNIPENDSKYLYRVKCIAVDAETMTEVVVYQQTDNQGPIYTRPLEMFAGPVDKVKYPQSTQEDRFELVPE